jgi:hypothetical protein
LALNSKISEEKILGGFKVDKGSTIMSRYGVFFTESGILFARIGFSPFWLILTAISGPLGFFCAAYLLLEGGSYNTIINFIIVLIVTALFVAAAGRTWIYSAQNKFLKFKFGKLPPETILAVDKKNFQIPYNDILRVEITKGSPLKLAKIIIQTTNQKYSYNLIEKKDYNAQINLIRSSLPEKTHLV